MLTPVAVPDERAGSTRAPPSSSPSTARRRRPAPRRSRSTVEHRRRTPRPVTSPATASTPRPRRRRPVRRLDVLPRRLGAADDHAYDARSERRGRSGIVDDASSFSCTDAGIGVQSCARPAARSTTRPRLPHVLGHRRRPAQPHDDARRDLRRDPDHDAGAWRELRAQLDRECSTSPAARCRPTTCTANVTHTPAPPVRRRPNTSGQRPPDGHPGHLQLRRHPQRHAGHSATLTHTYTVGRRPSISGKIVFTRHNRIWSINPDGTGAARPADQRAAARRPAGQVARRHEDRLRAASRPCSAGRAALGDRLRRSQPVSSSRARTRQHRAGVVARRQQDRLPVEPGRLQGNRRLGRRLGSGAVDSAGQPRQPDERGRRRPDARLVADRASARSRSRRTASRQFDIYTMTADRRSVPPLTNDKATDREPTWSPDGTKITFSSNRATSGTPSATRST